MWSKKKKTMRTSVNQNEIITGSIPKQLMAFFLPIWFGTLFQQLYNTADTLIVGNFVGTSALAAVGATGAFVQLMVGLFVGLCSGAGVIISQYYGGGDRGAVDKAVHTALTLSVVGGALLTVIGVATAKMVMTAMDTPADILGDATLYLQLYCLGMIPQMLYNMGTNILRAVGDSKRPLYFLIVASIVNIGLDLLFVVVFRWGVAGVALATVASQAVSAVLTLACIAGGDGLPWQLHPEKLRLDGEMLTGIARIGLPTAAQGAMYSISNLFIQAAMNSFGTTVVAAWSVYGKIDFLFWMTVSSLGIAVTTFAGQNFGAKKYDRVRRGTAVTMGIGAAFTVVLSAVLYPAAALLFRLFTQDEAVVLQGTDMMHVLVPTYITYISVELLSGTLRGCGDVKIPTLISVVVICGLRMAWLAFAVPLNPVVEMVEYSYPITWTLASLLFIAYYLKGGWMKRCIAAQQAVLQH